MSKLVNFLEKHGLKIVYSRKFTFIYSVLDKLYVFLSIYLSRNTDYYRNTVNWIKLIIDNSCLNNLQNCSKAINSYQYRELINITRDVDLRKLVDLDSTELLKVKGIGLKTLNAYMLHAYGFIEYAPIDRHYLKLLENIGVEGVLPSKTICIRNKLNCLNCLVRNSCLYNITRIKFSIFNGVIQSMNYVYSRLKNIIDNKLKPSDLEAKLLGDINERYSSLIDEFDKIIDILTSINRINID